MFPDQDGGIRFINRFISTAAAVNERLSVFLLLRFADGIRNQETVLLSELKKQKADPSAVQTGRCRFWSQHTRVLFIFSKLLIYFLHTPVHHRPCSHLNILFISLNI